MIARYVLHVLTAEQNGNARHARRAYMAEIAITVNGAIDVLTATMFIDADNAGHVRMAADEQKRIVYCATSVPMVITGTIAEYVTDVFTADIDIVVGIVKMERRRAQKPQV